MAENTAPDRRVAIRSAVAVGLVLLCGWTWQVYQFGYNQRAIDSQFGIEERSLNELSPPTRQQFHIIIRSLERVADRLERELRECRRELENHEC